MPFFLQVLITPLTFAALRPGVEMYNPCPTPLQHLCKELLYYNLFKLFYLTEPCASFQNPMILSPIHHDLLILMPLSQSIQLTISTTTHLPEFAFIMLRSSLLFTCANIRSFFFLEVLTSST